MGLVDGYTRKLPVSLVDHKLSKLEFMEHSRMSLFQGYHVSEVDVESSSIVDDVGKEEGDQSRECLKVQAEVSLSERSNQRDHNQLHSQDKLPDLKLMVLFPPCLTPVIKIQDSVLFCRVVVMLPFGAYRDTML